MSSGWTAPDGLSPTDEIRRTLGGIRIATSETPAIFWVEASGFITPALLREDLERAESFGRRHPEGWSYVADVSRVRAVHPMNPLELRRIPGLPNLGRYVVVTQSRFMQWMIRSGRRVVSPDAIVATSAEALTLCRAPARSPAPR